MKYTLYGNKHATPLKISEKMKALGFNVGGDTNKIEYNEITGSPNPKPGSNLVNTDFRLEFIVTDTATNEIILTRIEKIFGPKNKITSIKNATNKQLSFNKTVSVSKEDLIKCKKVNTHLKGKKYSAAEITKKHISHKVDYEINMAACQLLHLVPKIFSGKNIDTQTIDNTFPGIMEANITQRSASETFTKQLITKNKTKTVFYNPKLFICNQKLQDCKNEVNTQIGDLMEMNVSYIPNANPSITCKMSVQIPTLKTILDLGDRDKTIRKVIKMMIKEINKHYCKRSYDNKVAKRKRTQDQLPNSPECKKRKFEMPEYIDANDPENTEKSTHKILTRLSENDHNIDIKKTLNLDLNLDLDFSDANLDGKNTDNRDDHFDFISEREIERTLNFFDDDLGSNNHGDYYNQNDCFDSINTAQL